jgi:hypothetical protein
VLPHRTPVNGITLKKTGDYVSKIESTVLGLIQMSGPEHCFSARFLSFADLALAFSQAPNSSIRCDSAIPKARGGD